MSIPKSLIKCFDEDGQFNPSLYLQYSRSKRMQMNELYMQLIEEENVSPPKKRSKKRSINLMNYNGVIQEIDARSTPWYVTYVLSPMIDDKKFEDKFRRRFRCQYGCYLNLLEMVKVDPLFHRWQRKDASGKLSSPIELCLLGTLRYLARGWTFDDCEENTSISEETHRRFFHCFIYWGSTYLFKQYVCFPTTELETHDCKCMMESAGFHGCVASTDATHVTMMRCPVSRANEHRGPKESLPARSYNITVNHKRKILHTTTGHPSRWNDKTLTHYDTFIKSIREQRILNDVQFALLEKDDNNTIVERKYSGCWIMCDNGYQNWSCLMSPIKDPIHFKELLWSKWLESMRKDVECTFGILKGRFRILKTGIRLHKINSVDQLWCTCCALHNMFLEHDGLSKNWENGVQSDWQGELGNHVNADDHDYSGMGPGNDIVYENDFSINDEMILDEIDELAPENNQGAKPVRSCSNRFLKQKLIDHFDILYQKRAIKWPKRSGIVEFSLE
jgi:Plant transposon protein